jgi:hypothetical protein
VKLQNTASAIFAVFQDFEPQVLRLIVGGVRAQTQSRDKATVRMSKT